MRVDVYDRQDGFVYTIGSSGLISFVHSDELNGDDHVDITTTYPLSSGYRLVWKDLDGRFHEHICQDPVAGRTSVGSPTWTDTAVNSLAETAGDRIDDKRPYGYSFLAALEVALEPTRWRVGTVDQPGTVSDSLTFYHTTARAAINAILECGGELETEIEAGPLGVTSRKVSIRAHVGERGGHRRFTYGKDLVGVERTEHWTPITACVGYGKGLETDAGGYGRKLTFEDVNGGRDYVEDLDALELYGRPDGKGGLAHIWGTYENQDCDDAAQLLDETRAYLEAHKDPGVTYEASVIDLVAMGRSWEGVSKGDDVQLVDTCFTPTLRCQGRVSKISTDLLQGTSEVTLGNVTETLTDAWQQQQQQISNINKHAPSWDIAASTPFVYLEQLVAKLNERFNVSGMSYTHTSFEHGTIWSSVPLDEEGRPTKAGAQGIQLCSQGFRIAGGTKADGSFNWRTFGTGDGFTADLITSGTINADLIRAGVLQVERDGQIVFRADFASGDVFISSSASVGDSTLGDSVVSSAVEFGLSDSADEEPASWGESVSWQHGKVLWQRTRYTTADGGTTYGDPFVVDTEEGTGAVEQTDQYYLSTSPDEPAGGQWSDVQPDWVSGRHYWMRKKVTWSDGSVTYGSPYPATALTSANQSTDDLDASLDVEGTFNRLTNNGQLKGLYLTGGELYINGTYIKSGTIDADLIKAGILQDASGSSYWNMITGEINIDFTPADMATTSYVDNQVDYVNSRLNTTNNNLNRVEETADEAAYDSTIARNVTDRISIGSSGIVITGTSGSKMSVATYTSQGFVVASTMAEISSSHAGIGVKDWGFAYQTDDESVRLWVTDGTSGATGGKANFFVAAGSWNFEVNADGVWYNGAKIN